MTTTLPERQAAANKAYLETMSGVDKLVKLGYKKKNIIRMVSVHVGRRKPKAQSSSSVAAGLKILAGE
jgi:Holliday junction resolvasome RuvABC DNA-binding subunit